MRTSRRYQLRLPLPLSTEVEAFAATNGLRVGTAIRLLVSRGLSTPGREGERAADSPAALAALVASELTALMVASILPDGEGRMHELAAQAATNAEERLAGLRDAGQ